MAQLPHSANRVGQVNRHPRIREDVSTTNVTEGPTGLTTATGQQKAPLLAGFPGSVGSALGRVLSVMGFESCRSLVPCPVGSTVTELGLAQELMAARERAVPSRPDAPLPVYLIGWALSCGGKTFDALRTALRIRYSSRDRQSLSFPLIQDPYPIVVVRHPAVGAGGDRLAADPEAQIHSVEGLSIPVLVRRLAEAHWLPDPRQACATPSAHHFADHVLVRLEGSSAHRLLEIARALRARLGLGAAALEPNEWRELRSRLAEVRLDPSDHPQLAIVAAQGSPGSDASLPELAAELEELASTNPTDPRLPSDREKAP